MTKNKTLITAKPEISDSALARALYEDERAHWLALFHHRTHHNKPFRFDRYEYARDILRDTSQHKVWKKSTQGAATEVAIIIARSWLEQGLDVFEVFPTDQLKNRFVKNRWDMSEAYTSRYADSYRAESVVTAKDRSSSMSLKQYIHAAIAFVGSKSPAAFGEFPADARITDEFDNCDQANILMSEERLSNSPHRLKLDIGNPTIPNYGISKLYAKSDQKRWHLKCDCGHVFHPVWIGNVVRQIGQGEYEVIDREWEGPSGPDARIICQKCGRPVDRFAEGLWVPTARGWISGYHTSKLFSSRMTIQEMITRFEDGLSDPEAAQRFWNADQGESYAAPGSKMLPEDLEKITSDYPNMVKTEGSCFVGIDVGAVLHVVIGEALPDGRIRTVWIGTVECRIELDDLNEVLRKYQWVSLVIDERPETRLARKIAHRARNAWMCRYVRGKKDVIDIGSKIVSVDRTSALDKVVEYATHDRLLLPYDAMGIEGFSAQMTELTRVYDKDQNGDEGGYVWKGDGADHYFHAMGYMLTATRLRGKR